MAKQKRRNEKRKNQKNYAEFKKKGEVVFDFAYSLYTCPEGSSGGKAVKQLLVLKRKEFPGENLETGSGLLSKYRLLVLDGTENFEALCYILLEATKNESIRSRVLETLLPRFYDDLTDSLEASSEGLEPNGSVHFIDAFKRHIDTRDERRFDFFKELSACWVNLLQYLDLLGVWGMESIPGDILGFFDNVNGSRGLRDTLEMIHTFSKPRGREDRELIDSYRNDTEFYKLISEDAMDMFAAPPAVCTYDGRMEYGRGLDFLRSITRSTGRLRREEKVKSVAVLAPPSGEEEKMPMPEKDSWVTGRKALLIGWLNRVRCERFLSGIDAHSIAVRNPINAKEARTIIKKAFLSYDAIYEARNGKGSVCPYTKEADMDGVAELIVRLWMDYLVSRQAEELLDEKRLSKGRTENKELSEATALIRRLREEKDALLSAPKKRASKEEETIRSQKAAIKALEAKLHDIEAALSKEKARSEESEKENRDLRRIFELEMNDEDGSLPKEEDFGVSEEFFAEYIKENKVLIWGLRASTEQRYRDLYPELSFASSERRLTRQQLENYDVLIMCTSNTNHANYWAARDTAKALGIKMAYLAKSMNDPKYLSWALGIALGERDAA